MLYGSYGTQNSLVTSISKFGPRKGQDQVKLGQVRSNFQIKIYLQRHAYLVHFCLRTSKMSFALMYDNYKCHKMRYKSDVITISCFFFCHCTAKNKDIVLKFECVLCMYLDDIHSCFLISWKVLNFISNYFLKENEIVSFGGSKSKNGTIPR